MTRPGPEFRLRYAALWTFTVFGIAFIISPLAVVVVNSFSSVAYNVFPPEGFSTRWYGELAGNELIREGFINTMIVALSATVLATILGTLLAIGVARYFRSAIVEAYSLAPAIIPDLALAIGLLAFFSLVGVTLSLFSVLLSHVVFGMAFVAAVVIARLSQSDPSLEEASRDLGAGASTLARKPGAAATTEYSDTAAGR